MYHNVSPLLSSFSFTYPSAALSRSACDDGTTPMAANSPLLSSSPPSIQIQVQSARESTASEQAGKRASAARVPSRVCVDVGFQRRGE